MAAVGPSAGGAKAGWVLRAGAETTWHALVVNDCCLRQSRLIRRSRGPNQRWLCQFRWITVLRVVPIARSSWPDMACC